MSHQSQIEDVKKFDNMNDEQKFYSMNDEQSHLLIDRRSKEEFCYSTLPLLRNSQQKNTAIRSTSSTTYGLMQPMTVEKAKAVL